LTRTAKVRRPPVVSVADGKPRPLWRGRLHLVAFLGAFPAAAALLTVADSTVAVVAVVIYGLSLISLFGTSAAYHLLARSTRSQWIMRRLDHSMIFVQIAGTYTPVCLLALPRSWGIPILAMVWTTALVGVAVKLTAGLRLLRVSNGLYLAMGWVAVVALPTIVSNLTGAELALLVVGGVVYTAGAFLFYLKWPTLVPEVFGYHESWHAFTVVAAAAHYAMVWLVVAGTG
jgi:hemolysin III